MSRLPGAGLGAGSAACGYPALKLALCLISCMHLVTPLPAVASQEIFSLFLLRHAEKQTASEAPADPALTHCGERRAQHLARVLASVPVARVYSSDFQRTRQTAGPLAAARGLALDSYDPGQLPALAETLLARQQDAVIVGHSDTTSVLAGLLVGRQLLPFEETEYDRLYQVVRAGGQGRIYLLHQGFDCSGAIADRH